MIRVYKKKPKSKKIELVTLNDIYFNKITAALLDDRAADIIRRIDRSEWINKYQFRSQFDGSILNIDKLSTGCKTALNVLYGPETIFDIRECGDNALNVIYSFPVGSVYCDYPFISFEMGKVIACDQQGEREIDDYEKLKEWWLHDN